MADAMEKPRPWFAGKKATVLVYKVNRRPIPQASLFASQEEDVLTHFSLALPFGEPVESGRRFKRTWFLGDQEIDSEERVLLGQIGWERPERAEAARFDQEARRWVDAVREAPIGNHAPFVFDARTGRLAVLKHPTFPARTIAYVFTVLLNRGEARNKEPTVEWEASPCST